MLRALEAEDRLPSAEEKRVLAQYTGWGHSPQVFDELKAEYWRSHLEGHYSYGYNQDPEGLRNWADKYYEHHLALKEMLKPEEWSRAEASTLNAHYTSREVIEHGLWAAARHLGFAGGRVLENSAGPRSSVSFAPAHLIQLLTTGCFASPDSVLSRPCADAYRAESEGLRACALRRTGGCAGDAMDRTLAGFGTPPRPTERAIILRPAVGSPVPDESDWKRRYAQRHRMRRVCQWPAGIQPPRKVRVYWRHDHWLLQWWEPNQRKNVAERVDGDLIDAVGKSREIDRRLIEFRRSGRVPGRVSHVNMVEKFIADLGARSEAGQVEPRSVERYRSALCHYSAYTDQPMVSRDCPGPARANRQFALGFAAFLGQRQVSPNGKKGAAFGPMKSNGFVRDAVRAMYQWAADPDRGGLLPDGFRNPFLRHTGIRHPARDPFGEPDIMIDMAARMLDLCDDYQLRLFATLTFYGLRAAEPVYLFGEHLDDLWLRVPGIPELGYCTKGKRDKRLPLFEPLRMLLGPATSGLIFVRRAAADGREQCPLLGKPLQSLAQEIQRRLAHAGATTVRQRQSVRNQILREAGALTYDGIENEFRELATKLKWPKAATLKDLRHLFATALAAAGVPDPYRQYLMGHATTSAAIGTYTHLNRIREQYLSAVDTQMKPVVQVLERRIRSV
jgi:integrase